MNSVVSVSAGTMFTVSLKDDGSVLAWGGNWWGQLGDGTLTAQNDPVKIADVKSSQYTVAQGDSLWKIAKSFLSDGSKYPLIYKANEDIIGSNPHLIYPGQVFVIP